MPAKANHTALSRRPALEGRRYRGPRTSRASLAAALAIALVLAALPARAACPSPAPNLVAVPARTPANVCTPKDMALYESASGEASATARTVQAALAAQNPACSGCIYSAIDDPTWGPIVFLGAGAETFENFGACFETISGGSPDCGASVQGFARCQNATCSSGKLSCATASDRSACLKTTASDPASCGKYDFEATCSGFSNLAATCGRLRGVIDTICSNPDAAPPPPAPGRGGPQLPGSGTEEELGESSSSSSGSPGRTSPPAPAATITYEKEESGCSHGGAPPRGSMAGLFVTVAAIAAARRRRARAGRRPS